jgi:hypothetical protein
VGLLANLLVLSVRLEGSIVDVAVVKRQIDRSTQTDLGPPMNHL